MTTRQETAYRTFTAGEAIGPALRVKHGDDGNTVVLAGATELGIGVSTDQTVASGGKVTVRLFNDGGTFNIAAAGVIADKATAYAAASGQVAATGTVPVAINIGTSVANGWQEVIPLSGIGNGAFAVEHTVTAGEDTAGQADIDTGFGVAPGFITWSIRTSAGVIKMGNQVVSKLTSGDAGKVRFADGGTETVAAGDVISLYALR